MSNDDEIQAQIASIEAQLAAAQSGMDHHQQPQQQQQFAQWQPQASTFQQAGYGVLQPQQGFPQQQQQQMMMQQQQQQQALSAKEAARHPFAKDTDDRSVFVMNIPRSLPGQPQVTPEELASVFMDCGPILTCTVLKDRRTGELTGTAYIEFATHEACGRAIDTKNNAIFRGAALMVTKKRSRPFAGGPPRGGGMVRGRGAGRGGAGGFAAPDPMQAMMALMAMSAAAFQQQQPARGGRGGGRGNRGGGGGGGNFQPFQ